MSGCLRILLATLCVAFALAQTTEASSEEAAGVPLVDRATFGVYAHIRSTEMYRKMVPLHRYLRESMAAKGVQVQIQLRIFSTYAEAIESLAQGQVDFVRFGPVSYVLAKKANPAIRLLAMESNDGKKRFSGVLAVSADSPIQSVEDLRGKRVAFGNRRSTTGRYLAQAALFRAGIQGRDLAEYAYLGRHDKVAFALAAGAYDAGAMNENTLDEYAESKGLRRLLEFPSVTKPWVARAGMDEVLYLALRDALLELRQPEVLGTINRSGLLPATDADFDLIREAMALAKLFEDESLTFAIYSSERPSVVYNMVRPLLDELQQTLAAEGLTDQILTKVFRTYQEAIDALVRGDVDFGRFGPASYLVSQEANANIRVLAGEDVEVGSPNGVFVVGADSPITRLDQLKGKTLAFGNRRSTSGRYLAQAELVKGGITGADLKSFSYLGRHDRVAYAVAAGNYDAGVLRDTVLQKYDIAEQLRVIDSFSVPPKVWIARDQIDDDLVAALRDGLLEMRNRPSLGILGIIGFRPVDDKEYEVVLTGMRLAEQFAPSR